MSVLPRPSAILFDWDNTLVDTFPVIHASLSDTFLHMGHLPWTEAEVRDRIRLSLRDAFPILFAERWEEAREVFYKAFETRHLEALTPMPGAVGLMATLADTALPLGVVSNKTGRYLRAEAAHLGWDRHFRALVGAGDATRDKPQPDPAILALEACGVPADGSVWFVGDSGVDMQIAHAAGLTPVLLRADAGPPGEFDQWVPAVHVRSSAALSELVVRALAEAL